MKTYLVRFTRQIPKILKFEIEADNRDEAIQQAYDQFDGMDWSSFDEIDSRWTVSSVKELESESK
jgi:hypothetical protein